MTTSINTATQANGHDKGKKDPVFNVHTVFLKDLSFEAPSSPEIFNDKEEWKPNLDFNLTMGHNVLVEKDGVYEVIVHVTATMKLGEGKSEKTVFLIELQQAGVFTIQNLPDEVVKQILATTCPTILFPYAREMITSLASKGGFPQLIVPPINFDAMYADHRASQGDHSPRSDFSMG